MLTGAGKVARPTWGPAAADTLGALGDPSARRRAITSSRALRPARRKSRRSSRRSTMRSRRRARPGRPPHDGGAGGRASGRAVGTVAGAHRQRPLPRRRPDPADEPGNRHVESDRAALPGGVRGDAGPARRGAGDAGRRRGPTWRSWDCRSSFRSPRPWRDRRAPGRRPGDRGEVPRDRREGFEELGVMTGAAQAAALLARALAERGARSRRSSRPVRRAARRRRAEDGDHVVRRARGRTRALGDRTRRSSSRAGRWSSPTRPTRSRTRRTHRSRSRGWLRPAR